MKPAEVLKLLEEKNFKLAVAESLTGGALTAELVTVAGASKILLGGIVAYQTSLKHELLGVSQTLLTQAGAVNPQVAAQMAGGVRSKLAKATGVDEALVIGVATTGVAGPETQDGAAVGTVFIAISAPAPIGELVFAHRFEGDRQEIRKQTVQAAIEALAQALR